MSNSKKITDLTEAKTKTDLKNSFFVIAKTDSNKKISYENMKTLILDEAQVLKFNPETIEDYNNLPEQNSKYVLTAKGGKIIATALGNYIPVNSNSQITVNTPLLFPNNTKLKIEQQPSDNNDAINLRYLNSRISASFFSDFQTKEYIYGDEILTTLGNPLRFDKSNPNNWVVIGKIPESSRTCYTGWQKMNTTLFLKPNKQISDYKKIIMLIADEIGNDSDADTQIYEYSFDCGEYIHFFEQYKKRLEVWNTVGSASNSNPKTLNICGQQITWKGVHRTKNHDDHIYISPNRYLIDNGSDYENSIFFKYTTNYNTSITTTNGQFLVAVIGLK